MRMEEQSSRLGNGRFSSISVASHTTHRAVRQWAVQSYSRPDMVCCLFSFPHPCRLSYISYVLHQGYALICNRCRTPAWNIHSNRQIGLFGPSLFPGTMASADSSHFDFLGVALCEASWDKSLLFPRLPLWFTPWSYVCLLDSLLLANSPVHNALISHFCS